MKHYLDKNYHILKILMLSMDILQHSKHSSWKINSQLQFYTCLLPAATIVTITISTMQQRLTRNWNKCSLHWQQYALKCIIVVPLTVAVQLTLKPFGIFLFYVQSFNLLFSYFFFFVVCRFLYAAMILVCSIQMVIVLCVSFALSLFGV